MVKKKRASSWDVREVMDCLNQLIADKPFLPVVIPVFLVVWGIEKWIFSLTNWVPLVVAVWAVFQYGSYQRKILAEDLNNKWKQVLLETSPTTPLEQCEWLNKLLIEVWPNYISPRLSLRFSSIVERRMKQRRSKLIEKIELQEFSLGSKPPVLGLRGVRWSTSNDQRIAHLGFDWDTTDISIMLLAKLGKPLMGTARIVVNSIHIKGDLRLVPVLDGRAFLYSFVASPDVRINVAFGSGGSQSLPATELPGVSAWLVKLVNDSLAKRMVEPRRNCFSLPAVNLFKTAVAGVLSVTVMSASKLSRSNLRTSPSRKQHSSSTDGYVENSNDYKDLRTFVEVELEELTRRTEVQPGSCPRWDSKFNMTLHEDAGTIKFNLFECTPGGVKYDYLTSCEVKMRYVADDSTIFWATGADSTAIARRAEFCGKEIEMTVPFEGINSGELTVKLVLKEWQFADGSHSSNGLPMSSQPSLNGTSSFLSRTGRKIYVTIVEGKDLPSKDKYGKLGSGCYVKFQYGKALKRSKTVPHTSNAIWNQKFEFDEIAGGEYLKIKCFIEEMFADENIGSARVNLEGLIEGSPRDVWIPLEKVNSGELRLQIEAVRVEDSEGSKGSTSNGWVELALIEAKDLVGADLRGTSDPYVRVQYGNLKKRTKVMYKTVNPKWHQTLEFPDDGSPLELHVKDHNHLLPTSSIGDCVVEYQRLPPNEMFDKWIPLQNVKKGEIHIQVTRKVPDLEKKSSLDSESSVTKARRQVSNQRRTKGLVIWRAGSVMVVYRGSNYEGPSSRSQSVNEEDNALFVPDVSSDKSITKDNKSFNPVIENRNQVHPNRVQSMTEEESEFNRVLDGLGPRFEDWWGTGVLPVDADLLPQTIPGYKTPFRLLPTGMRSRLTNAEMTNLRKIAKSLPCHFALGRNRNHQGLAAAIVKLWEKSLVVKIAVKRGIQNTNNKLMSEELKMLTGGVLLLRNKYYIIFYRGKDFVPPTVAAVLAERQELTKQIQDVEEQTRSGPAKVAPLITDGQAVAGSLAEFYEAQARWGREISAEERERMLKEAAMAKMARVVKRLEHKFEISQTKKLKAEKILAKIVESWIPAGPSDDLETITEEERVMLRRVGLRMKSYLPLGIRGVFDGVIENMHLHWKHRELVKLISKEKVLAFVEETARLLEYESGGILVAIERVPKGYALIFYRGKNYRRPISLRPRNLLTKAKALKRRVALQRYEALSQHIGELETTIEQTKSKIVDFGDTSNLEVLDQFNHVSESLSEDEDSSLESGDDEDEDPEWENDDDSEYSSLEDDETG